ncbi:hypothetical protein AXG93_2227s1100 [Marchantia polymorpha subsp. ruderalis]|uniref:RING-type domain-containing protein n=1 Tax=Marchantia polymorpha subsp. ruderalis TaxID=1480154 RepID=A0A176VZC4_MARPO|nr:hypothetical protein AXG93_2227s1100 [Marchantia polymorpha subsp. ruderalis]
MTETNRCGESSVGSSRASSLRAGAETGFIEWGIDDLVWFQSVADESSSLLPFMMPCWPGGADYGPPEFEIDDTSSSSSRRGTSKIKSSLRVNNFVKSAANCDHDCTVCLSEFSDNDSVYELPQCKHIFHKACLNEWLQTNRTTCPLCRSSLQPAQCTAAVPGEMSATSDHYFDHRY